MRATAFCQLVIVST